MKRRYLIFLLDDYCTYISLINRLHICHNYFLWNMETEKRKARYIKTKKEYEYFSFTDPSQFVFLVTSIITYMNMKTKKCNSEVWRAWTWDYECGMELIQNVTRRSSAWTLSASLLGLVARRLSRFWISTKKLFPPYIICIFYLFPPPSIHNMHFIPT